MRGISSHGMSYSPEFRTWWGMKQRCLNSKHQAYEYYGGRGIQVCGEWSDFESFYRDMGPRPSSKHSLDRIDVNGDYEPSNCRWATAEEQANNKTKTVRIDIAGETLSLMQWCDRNKIAYTTARNRIVDGWNPVDAVTRKVGDTPVIATSGFRGVYFHKNRTRPFQAKVMVGGKSKSLGYFATAREASEAYQRFYREQDGSLLATEKQNAFC